jgi:hypothetical protein
VENRGNFGDDVTDGLFGTHDRWLTIGGVEGSVKASREFRRKELEAKNSAPVQ